MSAEIERRFAAGDFGQAEGDEEVGGESEQVEQAEQAEVAAEGGEQKAWAEVGANGERGGDAKKD